jgi:sulfite reductase beta subunit-like hemoprotein
MKARIKFLIDRIGIDEFRKMVEEEMEQEWANRSFDPVDLLFVEDEAPDAPPLDGDYLTIIPDPEYARWVETNVSEQRQEGYRAVTVKLPLGDIQAEQFHKLADMSRKYAGGRCRITHQQNLTFRWVPDAALYEVWNGLRSIGLGESGAQQIKDVIACPGTDSCKLGITSSMGLGRAITQAVGEIDTSDPLVAKMHVKMSGCPNGCGQHHIADIGFHGAASKAPGGQIPAYELFLGGSYAADDPRFGIRTKTKVPAKRAPEVFKRIVALYLEERKDAEEFKDYVVRVGKDRFEEVLSEFKEVGELNRDTLPTYMDWDKTIKYVLERGEGECMV